MGYSIFYSWQSDSPPDCTRYFIRDALKSAVASLSTGGTVEDSPRVDSDTMGISGTPEVAAILFSKIKKSAIFIGDMTLVGTIDGTDSKEEKKRLSNPNVQLEMGYAAGTIGWGRVICVMNEAFGKRTDLAFNVRNRRFPINYSLAPDETSQAEKVKKDLISSIKFAIETVLKNDFETVTEAISALDINCLSVMREHGARDCFAPPNPEKTTFGGALDTGKFTSAVLRLLDLKLIEARFVHGPTIEAYY